MLPLLKPPFRAGHLAGQLLCTLTDYGSTPGWGPGRGGKPHRRPCTRRATTPADSSAETIPNIWWESRAGAP
jgi:hypothetical protein